MVVGNAEEGATKRSIVSPRRKMGILPFSTPPISPLSPEVLDQKRVTCCF